MRHPIQCLHFCPSTKILFAGIGGTVQCFNSSTGSVIASWSAPQLPTPGQKNKNRNKPKDILSTAIEEANNNDVISAPKAGEGEAGGEESLSKKRKAYEGETAFSRKSLLGVGAPREEGYGGKNSVTKLLSVKEGAYLIVATNEDKTVRVFEVKDNVLKVLNERAMPKRPSAITMTDNDDTILLADKFGDVYALPLLPSPEEIEKVEKSKSSEKLTVAQLEKAERDRLAEAKRRRTEISLDLPFTHTLLLGHVSMLVDVVAITFPVNFAGAITDRTYVLTADRDEHIRISRYPQGFIIEGFCLGHESFVSKLLIPSWDRSELISGGGDDYLLRWDWRSGRIKQKIEIGSLISRVIGRKVTGGKHDHGEKEKAGGEKEFKATVLGMWQLPESIGGFLVMFESVPAVFIFSLEEPEIVHTTTFPISGNPLDIAIDAANNTFWVSVIPISPEGPTVEKFVYVIRQWENVTEGSDSLKKIAEEAGKIEFVGDEKILNEGLLYATGLLRKGTGRVGREE